LRSRSGDTAQELTPKSHASFENRNFEISRRCLRTRTRRTSSQGGGT
jgi:hypothetical protein